MKHHGNQQTMIQNITTVEREALESIKTQFQKFTLSAQKLQYQKKCNMNYWHDSNSSEHNTSPPVAGDTANEFYCSDTVSSDTREKGLCDKVSGTKTLEQKNHVLTM